MKIQNLQKFNKTITTLNEKAMKELALIHCSLVITREHGIQ